MYMGRRLVADEAAKTRIPAISMCRAYAESGGLMAYGVDTLEMSRRCRVYAAKILNGAHPGYLPMELPTKFELVINLKTAKALGLTISQSVLVRADEIIR
jgi:ABC-type uncharacterized transport system substrate-binding protein